jgi:hypothetical protein
MPTATAIDAMADGLMKREANIIAAARAPGATAATIKAAMALIFDAGDLRCHLSTADVFRSACFLAT